MRRIPPGPKGAFLVGCLPEFRSKRLEFLECLPRYGDITFVRLGREPVYSLHHPDLVREVLVEQPDNFQKLRLTRNLFRRVLSNDEEVRKTTAWKQRRATVQEALHAKQVETYAKTVVTFAEAAMQSWQVQHPLNIYTELRRLTLQIVAQSLFGYDLSDRIQEVMSAMATLQSRASRRFNTFLAVPLWLPTPNNLQIKYAVQTMDRVVQAMRQQEHKGSPTLLALLLEAKEPGITDKDVREEVLSLLMSGHETTATALSWTLYLIAQYPEVERRLIEELEHVVGERPISASDTDQLEYTQAVIQESLRLYPPSWVISRKATMDVELGGYRIPKRSMIFISPYSLHRDPRWFENPAQFCPERFLPDRSEQIPRYAYLPFGMGPRKCIGSAFAMLEITLLLSVLVRRFHLALEPHQTIVPEPQISLKPRNGIVMTPHLRGES